MRRTLLVTNDYPPKVGGIQNYLYELVRRLPPTDIAVYTTPHRGAAEFDRAADYHIERSPEPVLLPYPWLVERIRDKADEFGAELILLDPAVPLGMVGPHLGRPYGVVLHGAEVTIPGRLPVLSGRLRAVLADAAVAVSAGQYALAEAERCLGRPIPSIVIPPGVDTKRFVPLDSTDRAEAREHFGIAPDALAVSTVSRLVPRKGMHRLVDVAAELAPRFPSLEVLIGGVGRQQRQLERRIERTGAPVRLLGRLSDADVARLYGASDVMAMLCADRWGGLEQEGFGIVFLEAAAAGVPQLAGKSGGATEAVHDGVTGLVASPPTVPVAAALLERLLADDALRAEMGAASRSRAVAEFDYDVAARRLRAGLDAVELPTVNP